jgi:apolipoprotein N-acyltransferase
MSPPLKDESRDLPLKTAIILSVTVAAGYWIAFATQFGAAAILIALPCLCALARLPSDRKAFYGGIAIGMLAYGPLLLFFWSVFGPVAPVLWMIAGLPIGVFLLLSRLAHRRFGPNWAIWLTPVLWTGVEFFFREIWPLKFAWLVPGQVVAFLPGVRLAAIGVYGLGMIMVLAAAMIVGKSAMVRTAGIFMSILLAVLMYLPPLPPTPADGPLHVAGVQMEEPSVQQTIDALNQLAAAHPEAQILVLSEYTYPDEVPQAVRDVVRHYHRYLVAGGVRWTTGGKFYDAAFVIGPDGKDVFEQYKSVPVQFMADGLPATARRVWNSPWGKIGIGLCYDISYARVMDDFVRQGAQGLIVPTNDPVHWGGFERRMLHGRLTPIRAAEYGIPVFGVWSSGVSQLTDQYGRVIARAGYPGQGAMIAGPFDLHGPGRIPPDRLLAVTTMIGTGIFVLYPVVTRIRTARNPGLRSTSDAGVGVGK